MQPTNATNVHMGRARTLVMAFEGRFEGESIKFTDQCVGPQAHYCISSLRILAGNYKNLLFSLILCQYCIRNFTLLWNMDIHF